jgi:cytochrome c biogenesis protein CcdA/thiol-disulfide isomerase/thioredoxin
MVGNALYCLNLGEEMENILINMTLAFIEGLGLIVSPCILPILPIILSASIDGSKKRPIGIICGFVLIFALFTFFSRKLVQVSGIDLNLIRYCAFGLLILLGIIMISSYLTEKFARLTHSLANIGSQSSVNNTQGGFVSGILFGGLIAVIWTPCAGPILAAVIVQTVIQKTTLDSFFILLAFAFGTSIPMLIIALFGRAMMVKLGFVKQHMNAFRKLLGVIIIGSVVFMIYNDSSAASTFTASKNGNEIYQTTLINGVTPYTAPTIVGITNWINSTPLSLNELKGKVVLIDFWTYSCINCLRTLPYLTQWYNKYHDKGLVIIGIHSPEFDFEKNLANVKSAVDKYNIHYPVALDNNFATWQSFKNNYWPAHYLIDKTGNVVYQHFGEGEYDATENNIRFLLGLNKITDDTATRESGRNFLQSQTPETYLGFSRSANYAGPESLGKNVVSEYHYPSVLQENDWALKGLWHVNSDKIVATSPHSSLKIHFRASNVYIVMGSTNGRTIPVKISLNGEAVINEKGRDVVDSSINVSQHRLYAVITLKNNDNGILEITTTEPGLEIYTFTFG